MNYKKILTVQDISCLGQCSLTVALPIISACGIETCVLPSAVLSTHTSGFKGYTFRDLTEDIPKITDHWVKEKIEFDAIYTGYLGSELQIQYVLDIFNRVAKKDCLKIVDPAMADNGNMYPGFDLKFASRMADLCATADYVLPNITEACLLTGEEYKTSYDEAYIKNIVNKLLALGSKNVILTGVSYSEETTGIVVADEKNFAYYTHKKFHNSCHGTGDIYSSSFVGALLSGKSAFDSAAIAGDYTLECIKETVKLDNHWYGAAFEPVLSYLIERIKN